MIFPFTTYFWSAFDEITTLSPSTAALTWWTTQSVYDATTFESDTKDALTVIAASPLALNVPAIPTPAFNSPL